MCPTFVYNMCQTCFNNVLKNKSNTFQTDSTNCFIIVSQSSKQTEYSSTNKQTRMIQNVSGYFKHVSNVFNTVSKLSQLFQQCFKQIGRSDKNSFERVSISFNKVSNMSRNISRNVNHVSNTSKYKVSDRFRKRVQNDSEHVKRSQNQNI